MLRNGFFKGLARMFRYVEARTGLGCLILPSCPDSFDIFLFDFSGGA